MTDYIIRRLLALIPVMFAPSLIVFSALRLFAPIDIIEETRAESPGAGDPVVRERLRQEFGLDVPVHEQYVRWVWGAVRGDLGTSWSSGRPVFQQIMEALPVSLEISFISMIV